MSGEISALGRQTGLSYAEGMPSVLHLIWRGLCKANRVPLPDLWAGAAFLDRSTATQAVRQGLGASRMNEGVGSLSEPALSEMSARERLVGAAARLFCRFGINAIGVDAVILEAGTAKATLYKTFGSKEKLVEAVLEREGRLWRDWFLAGLDSGEASAVDRLRRIFPLLEDWFGQDRFYGCPFINAIGEHDKADNRMREITMAHKRTVLARIEELAGQAGARDPARLAHQIGLLIDGAIVVAMISRDPTAARLAAETAEGLLQPLAA